ncbi:MAG TPA: Wzz/FepE/Etk N-terminal domain-containing protein [Anaerolineae bacterium]|nr:Wzz/FepE/Etk N-terminal domain-containing protein [Anaerolineae bacterium]
MTLTDILQVLKKRFWLIAAGAIIAGAVAAGLSLIWPPAYEAEALLLITKLRPSVTLDSRFETVAEEDIVNLSIQDDQVRRQTLVGLAESADLANQVLAHLGDALPPEERSLSHLQGVTGIRTQGNLLAFKVRAGSAQKAAAIANAWAEVFQEHVNRLYSTTSPSNDELHLEIEGAHAAYAAAKDAVEEWTGENRASELTRRIQQKEGVLANLQAGQLAAAQRSIDDLLLRANQIDRLLLDVQGLKDQLADLPPVTPLTPGQHFALFYLESSAFVQEERLPVTIEFREGWLAGTETTAGEAINKLDQLFTALQASRSTTEAKVAALTTALLSGQELLDYGAGGSVQQQIEQLQAEINALEVELLRDKMIQEDLLQAQTVAQENHLTLVRKAAEIQIVSRLTGVEVQIATTAHPPAKPAFPRPLLVTAMGVAAGGLAGLALAFFLEFAALGSDRRAAA